MFYFVRRNASQRGTFSSFRFCVSCCLRISFLCYETGHLVFWFLSALTLDREPFLLRRSLCNCWRGVGGRSTFVKFSYSYGVPVLSKAFPRKEASSDIVLRRHAGQRFQTCRPTENLSFCSGEDHRNILEVNDTIL